MKKIFCLILTVIMALSMTAVFTACGGGDDTETLVCGVTEYEPMNFKDASGNWIGFDTEFALLVGEKLGLEVKFQEIAWANKYIELSSGTIDAIWNGFTANASESETGILRTELVDMSYAYMLNQQCVVIKADKAGEFTSVDALIGKTVAVESGSAGESAAKDMVGDNGEVLGAAAQINTFVEVKAGTSDCAVVDILLAQRMTGSGNYDDLIIADIELDAEVYAIGFEKGSPLKASVNQAMQELYDDGTLLELAEKYGLENSLILRQNIH